MTILLITNRFPRDPDDSASPFVRDFVDALRTLGAEVIVVTPLYGKPPEHDEPGVIRFPFGRNHPDAPIGSWNLFTPATWKQVARFVAAGRTAVDDVLIRFPIAHILALWALPSGWFARHAAQKWGTPYSVWCLGSDINTWARRPVFGRLTRQVLRDAEVVFADGFALAKAASRLAGKRCHFLPSLRFLEPALAVDTPVNSPHAYFLYAGRIHERKGVFDLVTAFGRAGSALRDFDLVFVGDGPHEARLRRLADQPTFSGRVRVVGNVRTGELVDYYRRAQATVIPSDSDSLPLVFSEAIQCGSPLIVYDTGDLGHFVRRFRLGHAVPRGDTTALSRALIEAGGTRRDNPQGRAAMLRLLDPRRAARKFLRAIGEPDTDTKLHSYADHCSWAADLPVCPLPLPNGQTRTSAAHEDALMNAPWYEITDSGRNRKLRGEDSGRIEGAEKLSLGTDQPSQPVRIIDDNWVYVKSPRLGKIQAARAMRLF